MEQIMLAPFGAPPKTQERISFHQVEILDHSGVRIGVVNTDAMAIALQNLGFAVLDSQKTEGLTFGQAVFLMMQGKKLRCKSWKSDTQITWNPEVKEFETQFGKYVPTWDTGLVITREWEVVKEPPIDEEGHPLVADTSKEEPIVNMGEDHEKVRSQEEYDSRLLKQLKKNT